jgi:hypothetical protein
LFSSTEKAAIASNLAAGVHLVIGDLEVHSGASLNLMVHADPTIERMASSPSHWVAAAGSNVYEAAAAVALNTGHDANPLWQDGDIQLNPAALGAMFLNPDPVGHPDAAIPADRVDAVSSFAHEFMHVLGIQGFENQQAPVASAVQPALSVFDQYLEIADGRAFFAGPHTMAANGGQPLELEGLNLYHVEGSSHPWDLMNGETTYQGQHYLLSQFDDAMLADIGLRLNADHQIWFV